MDPVVSLTRDLAEAQIAGDYSSSGHGHPQHAPGSSTEAFDPSRVHDSAPPQTVQVVRFPKDQIDPVIVRKQTIDVTPHQNRKDRHRSNIPDFRAEWGNDERWKNQRKADEHFVGPDDIPQFPQLHGWYVVFSLHEPRYENNTHKIFQGYGRHIHEDIFIAKTGRRNYTSPWTGYADIPQDFLSAKSKDGLNLWWIPLVEKGNSMMGSLIA